MCGILSSLFAVVATFATPMVLAFVVDYVLLGDSSGFSAAIMSFVAQFGDRQFFIDNMWILALALLCVTGFSGLFYFLRSYSMAKASEGTARGLRDRLYTHLQDLPYDYHKHTMTGDLIQRCTSDVDTIRRFLNVQLDSLVRCVALVAVALLLMFSLDIKLALSACFIPPILCVFSFRFFKRIIKQFTESDEAEGALSEMLNENVSGVRVVRAFGQQRAEYDKFEKLNTDYRDITYKLNLLLGKYWGFSDFVGYLQVAVTTLLAIFLAVSGEISPGAVLLASSYCNYLVWPIRQLGRVLSDMGKAKVSASRLAEITDSEVEAETGLASMPKIEGNISFKNVCFGYDYDNEVLDGVSFEVKKGQTVAVLGSTGSGKSSLMHLISRLYFCRGGSIEIDGVNVNDIERHYLRRHIGTVMQEPFLFSRSIADNIKMANPDATDEDMYEATRSAAIHDTILGFKDGYATMVGERGVTLSGGEKQRVSIARMLLQNAPIAIFDDSLSAVDTETDAIIREALASRKNRATTFIISHRITTLCESDFIIVLENGKISEIGTHAELIAREGLYRRIAEIQNFTEKKEAAI